MVPSHHPQPEGRAVAHCQFAMLHRNLTERDTRRAALGTLSIHSHKTLILSNPSNGGTSREMIPAAQHQLHVRVAVFRFNLIVTGVHLHQDAFSRLL